jgi:hypothetical protein
MLFFKPERFSLRVFYQYGVEKFFYRGSGFFLPAQVPAVQESTLGSG